MSRLCPHLGLVDVSLVPGVREGEVGISLEHFLKHGSFEGDLNSTNTKNKFDQNFGLQIITLEINVTTFPFRYNISP